MCVCVCVCAGQFGVFVYLVLRCLGLLHLVQLLCCQCGTQQVRVFEYYYSAAESKKLREHLAVEKNKTDDRVTQDKNSRSQTV